jgi:mannose-6-phosphate isomerase-like protein (cupin superfamily)
MRRVVTGIDGQGRSVIVSNESPATLPLKSMPGVIKIPIWGADDRPVVPNDGRRPDQKPYYAPPGGYRVGVERIPPDDLTGNEHLDMGALQAEMDERFPGWAEDVVSDPGRPGMHTTKTVDFVSILEGELEMEVDDGVTVVLQQGDWVVQNGVPHRWHNRTGRDVVLLFFQVGADPT